MEFLFRHLFVLMFAVCMLPVLSACGTKKPKPSPEAVIDFGSSSIYTEAERNNAVLLIKDKFASFTGDCELHSIRYAGDEANNEENLKWLNSLREARSDIPPEDVGKEYVQVAEFLMDFHTPKDVGDTTLKADSDYTDYQWWLARTADSGWEIVTFGYGY